MLSNQSGCCTLMSQKMHKYPLTLDKSGKFLLWGSLQMFRGIGNIHIGHALQFCVIKID